MSSRRAKSISNQATSRASLGCLAAFFGVFAAFGIVFLVMALRGSVQGSRIAALVVPIIFTLVGVGGVAFALRGLFARRGAAVKSSAARMPEVADSAAPRQLEPDMGGATRLLVFLGFAVFWNGITSVFVTIAVRSHLTGKPEWFLSIFIIPFVLIGLGLIGAVVYQALALFNPSVRLVLDPGVVRLGERATFSWSVVGQVHRMRALRIDLVGREEATYQRGTDTYTDKHEFAELPLCASGGDVPVEPAGTSSFDLPADTMHSFESRHNKIKWFVRVKGDVPRWPDVSAEYRIDVAPQAGGR